MSWDGKGASWSWTNGKKEQADGEKYKKGAS